MSHRDRFFGCIYLFILPKQQFAPLSPSPLTLSCVELKIRSVTLSLIQNKDMRLMAIQYISDEKEGGRGERKGGDQTSIFVDGIHTSSPLLSSHNSSTLLNF